MPRRRHTLLGIAVSALATSLVIGGTGPSVGADPAADLARASAAAASADQAVSQAKRELAQLDEELSHVEEDYAQAKIAQQASQQRADALKADVAAQQAKVDKLRTQAADIARASFQTSGIDPTTQLFVSGDPDSFLQQVSTVAKVDENMNAVLQQFQAEQANLADLKRAADGELAKAAEASSSMAQLESRGKANVAAAQAVLDRLSASQRAALDAVDAAQAGVAAAQAAQEQAAQQQAARATTTQSAARAAGSTAPSPASAAASSSPTVSSSAGAPSSAAAKALAYAEAHIGYPYVWAAEGPNAFDCSGLVVAAYRSAGVSLPHSSSVLSGTGRAVSRSELRPGDLIFWFNPVHHVSIYAGNGMMVHAVNPRVGVIKNPVSEWIGWGVYYAGARRVVG